MKCHNKIEELHNLASITADAALTAAPGYQLSILKAAETIERLADGLERKRKQNAVEPAIADLPVNATADEVQKKRTKQAIRKGKDVYLPICAAMRQVIPSSFLRSALFVCSNRVQLNNDKIMAGDNSIIVVDKIIASLSYMTITLSGYELCQFDRKVYSACLSYYRERPLSCANGTHYISTSFYEFTTGMGISYSLDTHIAIKASLLRLSFAQLRLRFNNMNIEIPKLLTVSFEESQLSGDNKGSDSLFIQITEQIGELFGPGAWTAVEKKIVGFDGLLGSVANFYASHSKSQWLSIEYLCQVFGYSSHMRNFKAGLIRCLEKLKSDEIPLCHRIKEYTFSNDGTKLLVTRSQWR